MTKATTMTTSIATIASTMLQQQQQLQQEHQMIIKRQVFMAFWKECLAMAETTASKTATKCLRHSTVKIGKLYISYSS